MLRLSEQNRVRIKKILAPRGTIFDKAGKILANTRPSFNLYLIPEDIKDFSQTVDGLVQLLDIDREEIMEKLEGRERFPLVLRREDSVGYVHGPGRQSGSQQVLSAGGRHTVDRA